MAFDIPELEPQEAVCGDRLQWTRAFDDFPASLWTLTYNFRGNTPTPFDVTATADGDEYSIDVSPTLTASYLPGTYYWSAFVALTSDPTSDRKLVAQGRMVFAINPVDVTAPVDGRSHARKVLEALNALIERSSLTGIQRYTLQAVGRNIDRWPASDLLKMREYYAALVRLEEQQEAIDRGEGAGDQVLVRFRTPR